MKFCGHYHEKIPPKIDRLFRRYDPWELKVGLWNAFVDSGLMGINDDDCAVVPRFLPASYMTEIHAACRGITLFVMRLLSLPTAELKSILPATPIRDYLIEELSVLKFRPIRLTGSFRFDMAIVGPPNRSNPPKLLEINDIGFDGLARSSYIQKAILRLVPELSARVITFDTAKNEVRNMLRMGRRLVRFQYDSYNWEEQVLMERARKCGLQIRLVSPKVFGSELDEDCVELRAERVTFGNGKLRIGPEDSSSGAFQMGYSFDLDDYRESPHFFRSLIRSRTPQYSPFLTGLVSSKTVLLLLSDVSLRRRLLGSGMAKRIGRSILPASPVEGREDEIRRQTGRYVLKHVDSMGGERVFVGREALAGLNRIPKRARRHWVAQERVKLNTIDVHGILSRPRRVMADLGVFVQYDWVGSQFANFGVGGFISRGTNHSLKVNVSGGGIQVPVMFDRSS